MRVVEWTSLSNRNTLLEGPYQFGPAGGVQRAVQAAYSSFPTNCLQVNLVNPTFVPLWADGQWLFSDADMYGAIQNNDLIEVFVNGMRPSGPDSADRHWVPDGAGAPGNDHRGGPGRGEGPTNDVITNRVGPLLRELQRICIQDEQSSQQCQLQVLQLL